MQLLRLKKYEFHQSQKIYQRLIQVKKPQIKRKIDFLLLEKKTQMQYINRGLYTRIKESYFSFSS